MSENLEYLLSQYVDGTLPAQEAAALEVQLASDAEARALLAEYRQAHQTLLSLALAPLPEINYSALADHISQTIAEEAIEAQAPAAALTRSGMWLVGSFFESLRIGWMPRLAVAASLLLAAGVAVYVYHQPAGPTPTPGNGSPSHIMAQRGSISVEGPAIETASAAPITQISISGPTVADAQSYGGGESILDRSSRMVVAAEEPVAQDMRAQFPY